MEGKIKRLKKGPKRKKLMDRNCNQLSWCSNAGDTLDRVGIVLTIGGSYWLRSG